MFIYRLYRSAFAGLSRDIWLLSLVLLVNRAGTMVLPFLALYLTKEKGFPVTVAGQILGLYGIGAIAGAYLGGWLSDRIGSIRVMQLSLFSSALFYFFLSQLESLFAISAIVLCLSAVAEAYRPATMSAATGFSHPANRARALALLRLAANLAMSIGPAVGGLLALYSYFWLFVGDGITCLAALALLLIFFSARESHLTTRKMEPGTHDRSPWKDGPFLMLMLLTIVLASVFLQIFSTFPIFLREAYLLSEEKIGILIACNALIIILFEMLLIKAVEKMNMMLLVGLGGFLTCLGFFLLPFGSSLIYILFTIVVWTCGEMLSMPLTNTIIANRASSRYRGRYMALYTISFSIAFVISPITSTTIYEKMGPDILWYSIGLIGILLAAGFAALSKYFKT